MRMVGRRRLLKRSLGSRLLSSELRAKGRLMRSVLDVSLIIPGEEKDLRYRCVLVECTRLYSFSGPIPDISFFSKIQKI
jgi:hypothetical protein